MLDPRVRIELEPRWWVLGGDSDRTRFFLPSGEELTLPADEPGLKVLVEAISDSPKSLIQLADAMVSSGVVASEFECRALVLELVRLGIARVRSFDSTSLTLSEVERYKWQLEYFASLERGGLSAATMLRRLRSARVCIVGVGGQGSLIAQLLASSGVGHLTLVDGDVIERSNLPRQFLYYDVDVGRPKVDALSDRLRLQNPEVILSPERRFVSSQDDALSLTVGHTVIVVAADQPRLRIHEWLGEASLSNGIPYIGTAGSWVGPLSVPFQSPCYVCQGRRARAEVADFAGFLQAAIAAGVGAEPSFPPRPALLASLVAAAVIEFIAGIDADRLSRSRFRTDLWGNVEFQRMPRYADCPRCGAQSASGEQNAT